MSRMRAQRPAPLADELLEPAASPYMAPSGGGARLLGRVHGAAPATEPEKRQALQNNARGTGGGPPPLAKQAEAAANDCSHAPATPGERRHLLTPLSTTACLANLYCFTPLATPSPSARCRFLEHFHLGFDGAAGDTKAAPVPTHMPQPLPPGRVETPPYAEYSLGFGQEKPVTPRWRAETQQAPMLLSTGPLVPPPKARVVIDDEEEDDDDFSEDGSEDLDQQRAPGRSLAAVPRPPEGALHPSLGSSRHAVGACRRCCFFPRGRCINGYDCEFCHYEHEKRKRKSKRKSKKVVELPVSRSRPQVGAASPGLVLSASQLLGTHLMSATAAAQAPAASQAACGMGCGGAAQQSLVYTGYPGQMACTVVQMMPTSSGCFMQNGVNMMQPGHMMMAMPSNGMPQTMQQVISLEPAIASHPMRPGLMQQSYQWAAY